jgi:hypothetical protein
VLALGQQGANDGEWIDLNDLGCKAAPQLSEAGNRTTSKSSCWRQAEWLGFGQPPNGSRTSREFRPRRTQEGCERTTSHALQVRPPTRESLLRAAPQVRRRRLVRFATHLELSSDVPWRDKGCRHRRLPTGDEYKLICIDWMMRFAEAVNASVVLLCFNQKLGMQLSRAGTLSDYSVPNPPALWYRPDIRVLTKRLDRVFASASLRIRECYRLTHPGSWKRDSEPIREMVRNVIGRHIQASK